MLNRWLNLLMAVAAICLGGFLLLNYPLGPLVAGSGFLLVALVVFHQPSFSLALIPAVLPVIGFAPWTGWITFEELDLLVLATAAGGYARYALDAKQPARHGTSLLMVALAVLMSVSILVSVLRGTADAGGFVFGWFQGYDGPMNSVRIGKSFFLALLLLPLLMRLGAAGEKDASRMLGIGMAIGFGTASLAALWERLAFTDLLNFSSDYRTTGLFWEMHVGGAALDGWLLLTVPFSIWMLRNCRGRQELGVSIGLLLLATYACLTTFSRGVYLALLVSLPLLAWRLFRKAPVVGHAEEAQGWGFWQWAAAIAFLGVTAQLVFPAGGYRALAAFMGVVAVSLPILTVLRDGSLGQLTVGGLAGLLLGGVMNLLASFLPKGPYLLYALLFLFTFSGLYWPRSRKIGNRGAISIACLVGLMLSAANIAHYWGGVDALLAMSGALALLVAILIWGAFVKRPLWPDTLSWRGSFLVAAIAVSAVVAVFSGGAYMGGRLSASRADFEGRMLHWRQGLSMLQSPADILFGKGAGRFPANYYFAAPDNDFPGTYRIFEEDGNSFISLIGPRHPLGFGNILRISQRLGFNESGPFKVSFKVRAKAKTEVDAEVCEKHLLYSAACAGAQVQVKATNGEWVHQEVSLKGPLLAGGPWYAPRIEMFSFGIGTGRGAADVDDVALLSANGANLLKNGEFSSEMRHWFFSSDRDHLPWHAKNLLLNVLFDQGAIGLAVFLLLTACALWRLNVGSASEHELAPYLSAGIIGFLVVGLFDSLTDVPRLAFAYYWLVLYALSLGSIAKHQGKTGSGKRASGTREPRQNGSGSGR